MKPKKPAPHKSAPKVAPKVAAQPDAESAKMPPVELDRRGKPLPPRQRVGGIVTPQ